MRRRTAGQAQHVLSQADGRHRSAGLGLVLPYPACEDLTEATRASSREGGTCTQEPVGIVGAEALGSGQAGSVPPKRDEGSTRPGHYMNG